MKKGNIILFLIAFLFGCTTPKSALDATSKGNEQIPSTFKASSGTLLIQQSSENTRASTNDSTTQTIYEDYATNFWMTRKKKNMVEYTEKNYPYKHEFASISDIYSTGAKYSDKNIYRFALVTSIVKSSQYLKPATDGSLKPNNSQPIFKFYLYDRLNNITYSALGKGSAFVFTSFKAAIDKLVITK